MDLKEIVSISGKGGLFKVISKSPKGVIVESIENPTKKMMVNAQFNVAMLEEITIFTKDMSDLHLKDIFKTIREKDDEKAGVDPNAQEKELRNYFSEIAPQHDEDRVYPSDIKKIIKWYNLLREKGYIDQPEEEEKGKEEAQDTKKEATTKGKEGSKGNN